jgi:hypothetical protein
MRKDAIPRPAGMVTNVSKQWLIQVESFAEGRCCRCVSGRSTRRSQRANNMRPYGPSSIGSLAISGMLGWPIRVYFKSSANAESLCPEAGLKIF